MSYGVHLTKQAEKDLDQLLSFRDEVVQDLLALESDPHKGHTLKGSLKDSRSLEFSLPGGAFRAAYIVLDDVKICVIYLVGPHEGFYTKAERRLSSAYFLAARLRKK